MDKDDSMMVDDMNCLHLDAAVNNLKVDADEMRTTLNNRSCNVCVGVDQLWICLECRQILCGPNAHGHSSAHFGFHKNHCIFINIESAAIFCFNCDSEVVPKNHDDELNRLRQFILYNRGSSAIEAKKITRRKATKAKPKKTGRKRGRKSKKKNATLNNKNNSFGDAIVQALTEQDPQAKLPNKSLPKKEIKFVVPKKGAKKGLLIKRGPRSDKKVGISNSGNNCFMNAVWQALRHMKSFIYCLKVYKINKINKRNNNNNNAVQKKKVNKNDKVNKYYNYDTSQKEPKLVILEELMSLLMSLVKWKKPSGPKCRDAISPNDLHTVVCKIKPRYKGFHQHDAHEFLMFTLDTLHSELKDEKVKMLKEEGTVHENPNKIDTLVSMMFRGYLLSEVVCLNCNTPSRTNDPFTDISLNIPDYKNVNPTESQPVDLLTDCLARYCEIEELNENNFYLCSKCESQQRSTKRFWFNSLPNTLCLHLKRFRWETTFRTKVHTHIKFPMCSLDMSQYLDDDMKKDLTKDSTYMYDLVSVIVHDGEGGGSGHYTAYALDDQDGRWYEFNDEKVFEIDASVVENLQAYLLFYVKREMKLNLLF